MQTKDEIKERLGPVERHHRRPSRVHRRDNGTNHDAKMESTNPHPALMLPSRCTSFDSYQFWNCHALCQVGRTRRQRRSANVWNRGGIRSFVVLRGSRCQQLGDGLLWGIELLRAPMEAAANKPRKACWYKCWYRRARIGRKHTKKAFGEIVSPVGPTSSFVAAVQRRGSCQTHHRACSKSSSWKSACRSDQNSSSPVPFNAPARPFERPISGTPHARRATRTRSRRSCCARPALSSRDRLSDDCWRHQRSQ